MASKRASQWKPVADVTLSLLSGAVIGLFVNIISSLEFTALYWAAMTCALISSFALGIYARIVARVGSEIEATLTLEEERLSSRPTFRWINKMKTERYSEVGGRLRCAWRASLATALLSLALLLVARFLAEKADRQKAVPVQVGQQTVPKGFEAVQ